MQNLKTVEELVSKVKKKWLILSVSLMGLAIVAVFLSTIIDKEILTIKPLYLDYFAYISILVFLPGGYYFYGKYGKDKAADTKDFNEKLNLFERGFKIKYTLFAISTVLLALTTMFARHESPLYMLGVALVILFLNKPSKVILFEDFKVTLNGGDSGLEAEIEKVKEVNEEK